MASIGSDDGDSISLNVMPLLDIFSILILFLLMSFSTDPINHDLNEGIELPESATLQSLDEIPSLVISKKEILVNDRKISTISDGDVVGKDQSQGAIYPLFEELEKLAEANKRFSKDKEKTSPLTVEVDKDNSFKLLKKVMLSAQQAEFFSFKMMVAKQQN